MSDSLEEELLVPIRECLSKVHGGSRITASLNKEGKVMFTYEKDLSLKESAKIRMAFGKEMTKRMGVAWCVENLM